MRPSLALAAALLLTAAAAARADEACTPCLADICDPVAFPVACDPVWAASVDWVFLNRDRPDSVRELVACNCPDGDLVFRANQIDPDSGSGARVRLYRRDPGGVDYEFSYLELGDWTDRRDFAGELRVLGTNVGTTGFTDSTAYVRFGSELRGAEINALVDADAWSRYYAGFRWVQLDEFTEVAGFGDAATVVSMMDVRNHLLGGQIGGRWLVVDQGGPWTVTFTAETGLYANLIDREAVGFGTPDLETTELSSVSELEIGTAYAFSRCWSVNLAAHFLWLTNVASAPEQFASPGSVADSSTVFYAGGSLGLTRAW